MMRKGAGGVAPICHPNSDAELTEGLGTYLDIESTPQFLALNALLANRDSFLGNGHNY